MTACIQRVCDILDLKACTDGVQVALNEEDYEQVRSCGSQLVDSWFQDVGEGCDVHCSNFANMKLLEMNANLLLPREVEIVVKIGY